MNKFYVYDLSNDYLVLITDTYERSLEFAKKHTEIMFETLKNNPKYSVDFPNDMTELGLIGIEISTVDYNGFSDEIRENHFYGIIKENGEVINRNQMIDIYK